MSTERYAGTTTTGTFARSATCPRRPTTTACAPTSSIAGEHRPHGVLAVAVGVHDLAARDDARLAQLLQPQRQHGAGHLAALAVDGLLADDVGLVHVHDLDPRAALGREPGRGGGDLDPARGAVDGDEHGRDRRRRRDLDLLRPRRSTRGRATSTPSATSTAAAPTKNGVSGATHSASLPASQGATAPPAKRTNE